MTSGSEAPIRVLVADDTATVRLLLRRTLESCGAFEVIGEAADGAEAVALAEVLQPDMVLLDVSTPVRDGLGAISRIRRGAPGARVIVLSALPPERVGVQAVEEGAAAFLEKHQRPDDLIAGLLQVWRSQQPRPPVEPPPAEGFRRAFEGAPLAMALLGADDLVLYANPALCRLTGYGPDELAALTMADLTHPEDRAGAATARRAVAARRVATSTVDARLVRPDGRAVWVSISCGACSGDDGAPGEVVAQLVDVSEQRGVERELTRSNVELSSFAYLAAHELKSPLQALSGFAALLDKVHGPHLDPQAREFVGWIVDGVARMDAVIEDLLTYCMVDTAEPVLARVALRDVVADAVAQLEFEVASRGASVNVDALPVVTGDPVQLVQLVQNLLANALKFVPEGRPPRVHVAAERSADGWTVTVSDNGIGVDTAARDRIFTMFHRLHPRERYKGTGIGLSICKRIVERRGGSIWVEPNPAGGSRFRFSVPDVLSASSASSAA
jgi:PAS domain S-box-containing protein